MLIIIHQKYLFCCSSEVYFKKLQLIIMLALIIIIVTIFISLCCHFRQSIQIFFICLIRSSIRVWNNIIIIIILASVKHFNIMNNKLLSLSVESIIISNICFFSTVFRASFCFADQNDIFFCLSVYYIALCIFIILINLKC